MVVRDNALCDIHRMPSPANVTEGKHASSTCSHAHLDLLVLGLLPPRDLRWVEVQQVTLVQHLPLSHLVACGVRRARRSPTSNVTEE
jgi:hypothetical protein